MMTLAPQEYRIVEAGDGDARCHRDGHMFLVDPAGGVAHWRCTRCGYHAIENETPTTRTVDEEASDMYIVPN